MHWLWKYNDCIIVQVVQAALDSLGAGRTVIVIAHRLSTIHNADRVVVMDRGTISEDGTPAALALAEGPFAAFLKAQTGQCT
jgi:ABC-type multidrug transport system fused ATPase/permease subunit